MTHENLLLATSFALILVSGALSGLVVALTIQLLVESITRRLREHRRLRVARIEAELDAKAEQLRHTILSLAEQLATEEDETSRQMTRAAFLASGTASSGQRGKE